MGDATAPIDEAHGRRPIGRPRSHEVVVNGRALNVLEDSTGILEVANSEESLEDDHPEMVAREPSGSPDPQSRGSGPHPDSCHT
jgi:hypothetical protein